MTKKNFLFLILTFAGALLFALGMCMCLLPEWHAFTAGVIAVALGLISLIAIALVRWSMAGRPMVHLNLRKAGKIAYCVLACLVLGFGMALVMVYDGMMIAGIIVGILGIMMALGCVPLFRGLK